MTRTPPVIADAHRMTTSPINWKDEIRRASDEVKHWARVHSEHPDWANPKVQLQDARQYLSYLEARHG